jgi:hypothetical protein
MCALQRQPHDLSISSPGNVRILYFCFSYHTQIHNTHTQTHTHTHTLHLRTSLIIPNEALLSLSLSLSLWSREKTMATTLAKKKTQR